MNSRTFKIVKNCKISTKLGTAFMGSIVNSGDVIVPGCLPGMLKAGQIEEVKDAKTKLASSSPEKLKPAPKGTNKDSKTKPKPKPKED